MRTTIPTRKEDVQDPVGRTGWPKDKGRDGERTPMQWDSSKHAGFTTGDKTWLPVPPSAEQVNVAVESKNPDSILNFYKKLIALRKNEAALRDGDQKFFDFDSQNVLAYVRRDQKTGDAMLIALNMNAEKRNLKLNLSSLGVKGTAGEALVSASGKKVSLPQLQLAPFEVLIARIR